MELVGLLDLLTELPAYGELREALQKAPASSQLALRESARPCVIAALSRHLGRPILLVTARPETARRYQEQLSSWTGAAVRLFPEPEALPYQRVISESSTEMDRLEVLTGLCGRPETPPLVVVSAPALTQKVPGRERFAAACRVLRAEQTVDIMQLLRDAQAAGYRMEPVVDLPGTVSHRGGIVDIFPPTSPYPVRLEFFGNVIESLRLFDPATQRSRGAVNEILVGPATDLLLAGLLPTAREAALSLDLDLDNTEAAAEIREDMARLREGGRPETASFYAPLFNQASLLDYMPAHTLVVLEDPDFLNLAWEGLEAEGEEMRRAHLAGGELPGNYPCPYFTAQEIMARLAAASPLRLVSPGDAATLDFSAPPVFAGQLPHFIETVPELRRRYGRLLVVTYQAGRLSELLADVDVMATPQIKIKDAPPPGALTLVQGSLDEGWVLPKVACLLTDREIFGFVKQRRQLKRRAARRKPALDIQPGDFVVHIEHGIAKFGGVVTRGAPPKEYLKLVYASGDVLYVPLEQIDRINRYVGAGETPPALSRLGTQEWAHTKEKTRQEVEAIAEELLELYASRELVAAAPFSADTPWQMELEGSFPYVETPDQVRVIGEIKEDMQKDKPMDRLVCGDVGYGKTEVALRAAFKAVMEGRQVAILVPTTILAQQHYTTFRERLEAFPVRVDVLSRFRTAREQQAVLEKLAAGQVDIIIGTHRLLQKDVVFQNLGLLVIDEEQRFGVAHKEHLKKLRREVAVLTLSATPIPRTLHMSLVGVRDISMMETPPEERLPIKSCVAAYDGQLVREAVLRELERNGQVFFVHNRVQSIEYTAGRLRELLPGARVAVGHGQMPEDTLERVMGEFARGEHDILVCTTIIESGLDMPNANTLIVNNADRMGLTQLYQLRGRIGRGANLAYAYFLYERDKRLSDTAQKRLKTIFEATELGAGFSIAMKDLEIRGAGSLLGMRQSGYISAVGFDLYNRLLAEAVTRLKEAGPVEGERPPRPPALPAPTVELGLSAYIPDSYVPDLDTRLSLYQRLVRLSRVEEVDEVGEELRDRFGAPPAQVQDLLFAVKVRALGARGGVEAVSVEMGHVVVRLFAGMQFDAPRFEAILKGQGQVARSQLRLNQKRLGAGWRATLEAVLRRAARI